MRYTSDNKRIESANDRQICRTIYGQICSCFYRIMACLFLAMILFLASLTSVQARPERTTKATSIELSPAAVTTTSKIAVSATEYLVGYVTKRPVQNDGYGEWWIDNGQSEYHLIAREDTTFFLSKLPAEGEPVYVEISTAAGAAEIISLMLVDIVQTPPSDNTSEYIFLTLHGSVIQRPAADSGIGEWRIFSRDGTLYTAEIYDQQSFTRGIPQIGQDVYVQGWRLDGSNISAERMEIDDGTNNLEPSERNTLQLSGYVVSISEQNASDETWLIRNGQTVYVIQSDAETRLGSLASTIGTRVNILALTAVDEQPAIALEISVATQVAAEVLVRLTPGVSIATIADRYQLTPDTTLLESANIHRLLTLNPTTAYLGALVEKMQADPELIWAEFNYIESLPLEGYPHRVWSWGGTDLPDLVNEMALAQINLGFVHSTYRGEGQVVAVLDTGVSLEHPQLQKQLLSGWDMLDDDPLPIDEGPGNAQGHGTHVSGIVLQVAPESQILPVRVLDPDGHGNTFIVAYAIEWAVQQGATVINLSQGTNYDSHILHDAIRWAVAQGVSVTAAAGNSDTAELRYPAAYTETLAITAIAEDFTKAPFANYGPWVDLAAPGVAITSTIVTAQGNGYASWSGTSMAAPFASATMALLHQAHPQMTTRELYRRVQLRSQPLDKLNSDYIGLLGTSLNVEKSVMDYRLVYLPFLSADSIIAVEQK